MPASTFQYLSSGTWTTETQYIRLIITDTIYFPLSAKITVSNLNNAREATYTDFLEVRILEGNTGNPIFYGRIERIEPVYDSIYGQTVVIHARDNLQELLKRTINRPYTTNTVRSAQISSIISDHIFASASIDTSDSTKYLTSTTSVTSGDIDQDFIGTGKNALRGIGELAQADKSGDDSGWAYYLDATFSDATATATAAPDLHYFVRGAIPPGGANTNGLRVQHAGTEADAASPTRFGIRSISPDYVFPKESRELVTRVRVTYIDDAGANLELHAILVNHGSVTAGPFVVGNTVTWPGSGSGRIEHVGTDYILIGPDAGETDITVESDYLRLITDGTRLLTSGGTTATANASTASPPGSLRETINQDIERVGRAYGERHIDAARDLAHEILYHSTDTIQRGHFRLIRWPYVRLTGTHSGATSQTVLTDANGDFIDSGVFPGDRITNTTDSNVDTITSRTATTITTDGTPAMSWNSGDAYRIDVMTRAGHAVQLIDIPQVTDQTALVTKITYDEAPGVQQAEMEVLFHSGGRGLPLPREAFQELYERNENTEWQTQGVMGNRLPSDITWSFDGTFSSTDLDTVAWGAGTLTLSDGRTFSIGGSNTGNMAARTYIYWELSSPTAFSTTTAIATALGQNNIIVAVAENNITAASFLMFGPQGELLIDSSTLTFDTSVLGWNTTVAFTSASATQVNWASGNIELADGTTYAITGANTGTMSARNYIYLDINVSTTLLQTTTTASTAVGAGKLMVATAINGTNESRFFVFGGDAATKLDGANLVDRTITATQILANTITANEIAAGTITATEILANTITANEIAANTITASQIVAGTITATEITGTTLSAIYADMGLLTAGEIRIGSGAFPGSFTGFTINATRLAGYAAGTIETEIRVSDGIMYAGAGAIQIGSGGITMDTTSATQILSFVNTSSTPNLQGWMYADPDVFVIASNDDLVLNAALIRGDIAGRNLGNATYPFNDFYCDDIFVDDVHTRTGSSVNFQDDIDVGSGNHLTVHEISTPSGVANTGRIYCDDNGSGKTRLFVIFGSGAAQQLAIEP